MLGTHKVSLHRESHDRGHRRALHTGHSNEPIVLTRRQPRAHRGLLLLPAWPPAPYRAICVLCHRCNQSIRFPLSEPTRNDVPVYAGKLTADTSLNAMSDTSRTGIPSSTCQSSS